MLIPVKYISPHPKSGILRYRRRVPLELQELVGKKEILKTLGTTDPILAMKRAEKVNRETDNLFATLVGEQEKTDFDLYNRTLQKLTYQGFSSKLFLSEGEQEARNALIGQLLERYGYNPEPDDVQREDFFMVKALQNDLPKPILTLKDSLDIYLKDHDDGSRNEVEQNRFVQERYRIMNMLIDTIGNKSLMDITRPDVRTFRDVLAKTGVSVTTVNKYLRVCRAVVEKGIVEGELNRANPFDGLQLHDRVAKRDKRKSFTDEELKRIVYQTKQSDILYDTRCITLALLDTGARLWEIAGLVREDVHLDAEIPYIHIRPNAVRGIKTQSSHRRVPLIGHALEAFKEAVQVSSHPTILFPKYGVERGNTYASTNLMNFLRKRVGITEKAKTIHSIRHTFKDRMRNAGIPKDVQDRIQGHSGVNTGDIYGEGYNLKFLKEPLDKLSVA